MPRRQRVKRQSVEEMTLQDRAALLCGTGWNNLTANEVERLRGLWHRHRVRLMAESSNHPWGAIVFE